VVAVYTISNWGLPLLSAFFFTLALSIKAQGALYFIPAFLVVVQYRYGTIQTLGSLAVIILWQYYVAYHILAEVTGTTLLQDYLDMSKLLGGDGYGQPGWGAS